MWGSADATDLERTWAAELWQFDGEDLRDAVAIVGTSYPDYPPTLPQFAGLCRDARRRRIPARLESPREPVDPVVLRRVVESGLGRQKTDCKAWARRILERQSVGEIMAPYAVACAREALGLSA